MALLPSARALPLESPTARPKIPADDELPGDLPPLDGEGEEGDPGHGEGRLDDDEMPKDEGDPFDDATGEGDEAPELLGLDDEKGSVLDAPDAQDLDIGAADLVGQEGDRLLDEGRDDERADEEYGIGDDGPMALLDGGEEGPEADDEGLSEDGLPPMAGDEGDQDDDGLADAAAFFDGNLRDLRPQAGRHDEAWSSVWERFGQPLSVPPCRALTRSTSGVLCAGRELVRLDLEEGATRLAARGLRGGDATRVFVVAGDLLVTTEGGGLFLSRDDGATFSELAAWREQVTPEEAAAGLYVVASKDGVLWGRTAQGALLRSADRGVRWEKGDVDGFVRALGIDREGGVVLLVRAVGAHEVLRRASGGWGRAAVPGELLEGGLAGQALVAARGASVAVAVEGQGVLRSIDGGAWSRLAGTETVTAMEMLDGSGTLVVALHGGDGDAGAQSSLARVGADGEPKVVAMLDERGERGEVVSAGGEDDPGVLAIAVDDEHQVVWVAGGFGVAAFQPKMRSAR